MAGTIIALVCIIISVVFAVIQNDVRSPSWWALLAIFAAIFLGAHFTIGTL